MKKPYIHKRILAYILDLLIVTFIATLITNFIPKNDEYEQARKELIEVTEKQSEKEITSSEYQDSINNINYQINKSTVDITIITITISLLYFVLFNYYGNGKTVGKRIMNLQIVGINDRKVTINDYLIRTLIVNSTLANIVGVILIIALTKSSYIKYYNGFSTIFSLLLIATFICMSYRNDGRGIHDILARTVVIDTVKPILNDVVENKNIIEQKTVDVTPIEKSNVANTSSNKKKKTKNNNEKVRKESIEDERV